MTDNLLNSDGSINVHEMQKRADEMKRIRKLREDTEHSLKVANDMNKSLFASDLVISTNSIKRIVRNRYFGHSEMENNPSDLAIYMYLLEIDGERWENLDLDTINTIMTTIASYSANIGYNVEHGVFYSTLTGSSALLEQCIKKEKNANTVLARIKNIIPAIKKIIETFKDNRRLKKLGLTPKDYF